MANQKIPSYLNAEQRQALMEIPSDLSERDLPHITPLGWEHINLIGQYNFTHQSARSLKNLRPLRLPEHEEQDAPKRAKADFI